MSGGRLVVLDRQGRDVKQYPLPDGLVTLGSDPACDIRVMLPSVSSHHATVVVQANQTVVSNVGDGDTLVNGECVSIAALQHGDIITLGDRSLRWEYSNPDARRHQYNEPVVYLSRVPRRGGDSRRGRRATAAAGARDRALHLHHRASMPASTGGKQVAIVQPQRRDTNEQNDKTARPQPQANKRPRSIADTSTEEDKSKRKSTSRVSPKNLSLQTTKATLWIESRKSSPRKSAKSPSPRKSTKAPAPARPPVGVRRTVSAKKSTPLRMAVLKKAQSAHKLRVMKIEAPVKIDHTKQAAIMLMTGHTPKLKVQTPKPKTPSYVVKKPSPVRKTPRGRPSGKRSKENVTPIGVTPKRASTYEQTSTRTSSKRSSGNQSVTVLEITDSDEQNTTARGSNTLRRSGQKNPQKSPPFPNPKKSSLKDPKKNYRKTESIKFDLSNLENMQESKDVFTVSDTFKDSVADESLSEDEFTLRYSDNSSSPSPRKSIHSRSSRILEKTLGSPISASPSRTQTPESPRPRKSLRGSLIVQKALENDSGRKSTQSFDQSSTSQASAFKTHTLSPRPSNNMESYSIVDLVSIDSNESPRTGSVYNSAESNTTFDILSATGRKTRSTIDPTLLGSSTPYIGKTGRQSLRLQNSNVSQTHSSPEVSRSSALMNGSGISTRRSKSLSTPENTQKHISVNSTRVSRVSRSRSRLNDSDLLLIDGNESDASPKTSRKASRASKSILSESFTQNGVNSASDSEGSPSQDGATTPDNRHSPQDVGTPVLSIQSLLDSSQNSFTSQSSKRGKGYQRKTIGVISENKRSRTSYKSKSLNFTSRRTTSRLRKNSSDGSDKTDEGAPQPDNEEVVTPKSAVKLVHEGVKNKHSTAKKPLSKRSIIDDLNQSDIVKQLFNSPVKRKLSQSMTEFSRKQLLDDDDDIVRIKRPTRNTVAVTGRTPEYSILDQTEPISPEVFVSPISTPVGSPNLEGIKRLFRSNTPRNDLGNVKGVKSLFRTPRVRRSVRNDLTNVAGVKAMFAKSPRNRLSDVAVKELFVSSPNNDLRRVSGIKSLFQSKKTNKDPKNDLTDVRGVKSLFKNSPANDLRNVSGVKKVLRRNSPRNDLRDVRGVKKIFKETKKQTNDCDVSGIEELFNESNHNDNIFDQLLSKPQIRAVYSNTFSGKTIQKAKHRRGKSLHASIDAITNNVEEWLEQELQKRLNKNTSKSTVTRELKKLATSTVEGTTPIRTSRVRDSTLFKCTQGEIERKKSASEIYSARKLPIKKRSLVEASLEKSRKEDEQKSILPIKKRVVVHSTPVKGRINLTMNASMLGRVSPIAPDRTRADGPDMTTENILEIPQPKPNAKASKVATISIVQENVQNISPKKTRAKAKASPPKARATRNRKEKSNNLENKQSNRASVVKAKKSPVKPAPKSTKNKKETKTNTTEDDKEKSLNSPKKTTRRQKVTEMPKMTPKRTTRAKIQKNSLVVSKPSPQLKPRATRNAAVNKESNMIDKDEEQPQRTKVTRKNVVNENSTESQPPKRRTRAALETEPKSKERKSDNAKRQTKEVAENNPPAKRGRRTNAQEEKKTPVKEKTVKTRGKSKAVEDNSFKDTNALVAAKATKTRSNAKVIEEKNVSTTNKQTVPKTTRGRGKVEPQSSVQSKPTRQARRTKVDNTLVPEEKGRKRKTGAEDIVPSKVTRGRKKTIETTESETAQGRQKRSVVKDSKIVVNKSEQERSPSKATKVVRSKKVVEKITVQPIEQPTRGRKRTTIAENVPENKRTKKSKPEMSPVKEAAKKQPASKKATKATSKVVTPLKTRGRSTRGKSQQEVEKKPVARSCRR